MRDTVVPSKRQDKILETKHRCPKCDAEFPTHNQLAGHIGGAHGRALVEIRHGTEYGYLQHLRRKVPIGDNDACGCRNAHREYHAARRRDDPIPAS